MVMDKSRITYLVGAFFEGAATAEEKEELAGWINQAGHDDALRSILEEAWYRYEPDEDVVAMAGPFMDRLQERMFRGDERQPTPDPRVIPLTPSRRRWKPLAAAAVLLLIATGVFLWQNRTITPPALQPVTPQTVQTHDVKPGGNKALLTLADGSHITLDSAGIGALAQQGGTSVEKTSSEGIAYRAPHNNDNTPISYNTLSTPRGGRYQLTLPDGTIVWLNAASSITYPVAFTGDKRKVTVTGESYFEVHSDPAHPFVVSKDGMDVTVLGTQFNVNAYDEEEQMRVTLVDGAVKVDKAGKGVFLKPGQQAQVATQVGQPAQGQSGQSVTQSLAQVQLIQHVNLSAVTAWKNGSFNFDGKTLPEILRQLSRWYDVDVVYQGPVRKVNIAGAMGMDLNLSQVLKVLQKTGVNVRLEEKNLIILP